jgi:outer membrane protein with beta-barrel domain
MTSTMRGVCMRPLVACAAALVVLCAASPLRAQDPPPRIGPFVLDLHASVPQFPSNDSQLAESRRIDGLAELPGSGLGIQAGAHLYLLKIKAVTFGIGAEFAAGRASQTPAAGTTTPALEERFSTFSPQLSLNFGTGRGWSYLSGGIGVSNWALVPEGREVSEADSEPLKTINYGGGARWFIKPHLAFSLDVRFYAINPGTPYVEDRLGSPRTTLMIIGAGISLE